MKTKRSVCLQVFIVRLNQWLTHCFQNSLCSANVGVQVQKSLNSFLCCSLSKLLHYAEPSGWNCINVASTRYVKTSVFILMTWLGSSYMFAFTLLLILLCLNLWIFDPWCELFDEQGLNTLWNSHIKLVCQECWCAFTNLGGRNASKSILTESFSSWKNMIALIWIILISYLFKPGVYLH